MAEDYLLGYEPTEKKRLDTQHDLLMHSMGYAIHPLAKAQLKTGAWIVDVGKFVALGGFCF